MDSSDANESIMEILYHISALAIYQHPNGLRDLPQVTKKPSLVFRLKPLFMVLSLSVSLERMSLIYVVCFFSTLEISRVHP